MKREIITITCDNCKQNIKPETAEEVPITIRGREYISDWCQPCADALEQKLNPELPSLTCHCGYVARSERGLRQHKTKASHD